MERVEMVSAYHGIATMRVCCAKDATNEEILALCNRVNPAGTSNGWCHVVRKDEEHQGREPVQCADDPERLHILVDC